MNNSQPQSSLDLLLPGLFGRLSRWTQDYGQDGDAPALRQLLNKSEISSYRQNSFEGLILWLVFKYDSDQTPYAVIRGGEPDQSLCADPVHFSASMNDVVVHRVNLRESGRKEFEHLINQHVTENDQQFTLLDSGQGLLSGSGLSKLETLPLSLAAGNSVQDKLPSGEDAAKLQTLATEVQMLLFDSPVAEELAMPGQLPLNGLWFWGNGDLKGNHLSEYSSLVGGSALQNISTYSGIDFMPEPESFLAFTEAGIKENVLIQLSGFISASDHDDFHAWQQALADYEQTWFQPLMDWLKKNPTANVRLFDDIGHCFYLNARPWYKRFSKTKSLGSWCTQ